MLRSAGDERCRFTDLSFIQYVLQSLQGADGDGCTGQKLKMMLLGERKRGRPQRSFMDVVKEDMQLWQKRVLDVGCDGDPRGDRH